MKNTKFRSLLAFAALACASLSFAATPAPRAIRPAVDTSTCTKPKYPADSMWRDEEGLNLVGILVGADGTLSRSSILLSSGYKALDRELLSALSKCRYKPGTVDGKPVEMWFVLDWLWKLEDHWGTSDLVEKLATTAANGDLNARLQLSMMLYRKAKTDDERNRATILLRDAAEQGQAMAQYRLGASYENGNGVDVDIEEALRWYEKAAAQGNVLAIERLRLGELPR